MNLHGECFADLLLLHREAVSWLRGGGIFFSGLQLLLLLFIALALPRFLFPYFYGQSVLGSDTAKFAFLHNHISLVRFEW